MKKLLIGALLSFALTACGVTPTTSNLNTQSSGNNLNEISNNISNNTGNYENISNINFDNNYQNKNSEFLVSEKSKIESAIEKIMDFAKSKNLTIAPVRGKVIEYLKRTKPNHYQALVRAKVVKDF